MTNLLDLPLDQFRGYLAEGNYPQARKEIRPGYANGVPWKNLTKQQRADFAAREGLLAASSPNLMQRGLLQ